MLFQRISIDLIPNISAHTHNFRTKSMLMLIDKFCLLKLCTCQTCERVSTFFAHTEKKSTKSNHDRFVLSSIHRLFKQTNRNKQKVIAFSNYFVHNFNRVII